MEDPEPPKPARAAPSNPAKTEPLPPVVARLVVEIRSDGTRTVARGALEDAVSGQDVAVAVEADSLPALLGKLTRSLVSLPTLLRSSRAELPDALPDAQADAQEPSRGPLRKLGHRLRRRLTRRR